MKLSDIALLLLLAAIWGSSFIFMRATANDFGPVVLITLRVGIAALCLMGFLLTRKRWKAFIGCWQRLLWIGLINSALPFVFLAYASLSLNAGFLSVINASTPLFTAWIAHLWLNDKLSPLQLVGMLISLLGVGFLVWDEISGDLDTWWPVLAGVATTLCYGLAANATKKYLHDVSAITATAGSLFFAMLFMLCFSIFFLPDFSQISTLSWSYALALGVFCTAFAYILFFKLIQDVGASKATTVTFLIPIFSFLWAYLLLGEVVTNKMWIATVVILFGTALVTGVIKYSKK